MDGESMKKTFLMVSIFLCMIPVLVDAMVKPTSAFYVNDYANVLSEETEKYIVSQSSKLNAIDGTQIVVVTIPSLEGETIENYANKLFNEFGIGDSKNNNGLLLLLALEERMFRVEVGYGLEGILPDGKTGRFQDQYIIPYLKNNDWDNGIINGYNAFYKDIVEQRNLKIEYRNPQENDSSYINSVYFILIGAILGIVLGLTIKINPVYFVVVWFIAILSGAFLGNLLGEIFITAFFCTYFPFFLLYNIIYSIRFAPKGGSGYYNMYHGGRSRSSGGGHFSSGGHFGGGGHSGGGGSSRHF